MTQNTPQTPEAVAYQLMQDIFQAEKKVTSFSALVHSPGMSLAQRQDIIDTYTQCIKMVTQNDLPKL
jgi:hypothetical protein